MEPIEGERNSDGNLIPIDYSKGGAITEFIENAETILETFSEYKKFDSDFKFKKLNVYGTIEKPYFISKYIYQYLYPDSTSHNKFIRKFGSPDDTFRNDYIRNDNVMICQKSKKKNGEEYIYIPHIDTNLLSELGLLKAMFMVTTDFTVAFQKLLLGFLTNVRNNETAVWKAQLEITNTQLAEEIKRGDSLDAANFSMNQKIMEQHQITNLMLNDDDPRDSDAKELHILRELLMKPLYIYVVSPEYVKPSDKEQKKEQRKESKKPRSKKIQMSTFGMSDDSDSPIDYESDNQSAFQSEFQSAQENYNHMSVTIRDLVGDPDKLYYIFVSKSKLKEAKHYKLVHTLKIYTKNDSEKTHYNMMLEIIKKGSVDEFPETFEAANDTSRRQYQKYLKDKKDTIQKEEKENIVETGVKISNHHIYEISYNTLVNARNLSFTKLHKDKLSSEYKHLTSPIYF